MIRSMTAFAGGEAKMNLLTIQCELRSVNHRFFDVTLKLPERFRFAEAEIRAALSNKINRGRVELSLGYKKSPADKVAIVVNQGMVLALLDATTQIEQLMQNPRNFTALEILNFPGIQQEPEIDNDQLKDYLIKLVDDTLDKMIESREREGRQLGLLIEERCRQMREHVRQAKAVMPEVIKQLRAKLTDRITELCAAPDFDRLEQELVIMTQKLDVDEELDRLETHIDEVLRVLVQNEPIGRRLDFLMQEMNREANTLGSKAADKQITRISIELKVLIEQMREQIQNIE